MADPKPDEVFVVMRHDNGVPVCVHRKQKHAAESAVAFANESGYAARFELYVPKGRLDAALARVAELEERERKRAEQHEADLAERDRLYGVVGHGAG